MVPSKRSDTGEERGYVRYTAGKGRAGAEEGSQKVKQRMNQELQECKV